MTDPLDPLIARALRRQALMDAHKAVLDLTYPEWRKDREMTRTVERVTDAWLELTEGFGALPFQMTTFPTETDDMITRAKIPFTAMCSHHLSRYAGYANFAYIPGKAPEGEDGPYVKVGISKIPRLVRYLARRWSSQEELSHLIVKRFEEAVHPAGTMLEMFAFHSCESDRGLRVAGIPTGTSSLTGVFREKPHLKAEAQSVFARMERMKDG
jgi:GTP cyclohydrolase IA